MSPRREPPDVDRLARESSKPLRTEVLRAAKRARTRTSDCAGGRCMSTRRNSARMRASSSRGENGFVR